MSANKISHPYRYLFKNAQENGKYFVVVFDGKNHRKVIGLYNYLNAKKAYKNNDITYKQLQKVEKKYIDSIKQYHDNMFEVVENITKKILKMEKEQGKRFLHRNSDLILSCKPVDWFDSKEKRGVNIGSVNPSFALSDFAWFIFERNVITEQQVKDIFAEELYEKGLNYEFWCNSGYYETDKYEEGSNKLFREYALQIIEQNAKNVRDIKNVVKAKAPKDNLSSNSEYQSGF